MGDPFNVLHCNVRDWSLSSRISLPLYIASCRQATRRSQVIVVVTQQNLEAKKKNALPSFIRPFLCLAISFLWPCGVDFNRESARGR